MTTFRDCLLSAVEQGAISKEAAADLDRRFNDKWSQKRLELGDDAAGAAAKAELEMELRFESIEGQRQVHLADAARGRNLSYLQEYRAVDGKPDVFDATLNLFESFGTGNRSIRTRTESIIALAHGELTDILRTFRRTFVSGKRLNRPAANDLVDELHGTGTGSPEAKVMADAVAGLFETLRQRRNAAGGNTPKLEGWAMPHAHDEVAIQKAGKPAYIAFSRERLDIGKMRDPLTGGELTPTRFDQVMSAAYDNIITNGWAHREPAMQQVGKGALASQRQEHRFLVFKDGKAWREYDQQFGSGDPVQAIFSHINSMAREIATMEVLGPNPRAMVEWLKQVNAREIANHQTGKPSLYHQGNRLQENVGGSPEYLMSRIDQVFEYQNGRQAVSNFVGGAAGTLRNTITSAVLGGGAITAALSDPVIDGLQRAVSGLPIWPAFTAIFGPRGGMNSKQIARAGIINDDFMHIMRDEARYVTFSTGASEWSKWLADRTLTWSGLSPMTQSRKHVLSREWMGAVADHAEHGFAELPDRLRATLERYDIDRGQWDAIRHTPIFYPREDAAGFIRPIDVAARDRDAAEAFLAVINGQTELHVPSGMIRARSLLTGGLKKGTFTGELVEGMLQFKSFGLSFMTGQQAAIMREVQGGGWMGTGGAYAATLAIGLSIGGAIALQLANLKDGKDMQPMNDFNFIRAAALKGGGFGVFGDFMFADVNKHGSGLGEMLIGPSAQTIWQGGKLALGGVQKALGGKDTSFGKDGVDLLRRNTPVLSSLWPVKTAYQRVLMDQLQYLVDPEAHRHFSAQVRKYERETGGGYYWQPGAIAPERGPNFESVVR